MRRPDPCAHRTNRRSDAPRRKRETQRHRALAEALMRDRWQPDLDRPKHEQVQGCDDEERSAQRDVAPDRDDPLPNVTHGVSSRPGLTCPVVCDHRRQRKCE
jgi:hypothetical protein